MTTPTTQREADERALMSEIELYFEANANVSEQCADFLDRIVKLHAATDQPSAGQVDVNTVLAAICEEAGYVNLSMQQIREVLAAHGARITPAAPQAASQQADDRALRAVDALDGMGFTYDAEIGWLAPQAATTAVCQPSTLTGQPDAAICQPAATKASASTPPPLGPQRWSKEAEMMESWLASTSSEEAAPLGSAQLSALVDMYRKGAVLEDVFQRAAALARAPLPTQAEPVAAQFKMPGETWEECSIDEEDKMRTLGYKFRYLYTTAQQVQAVDVARDAARYRFLVKDGCDMNGRFTLVKCDSTGELIEMHGREYDAVIDAAMSRTNTSGGK